MHHSVKDDGDLVSQAPTTKKYVSVPWIDAHAHAGCIISLHLYPIYAG